MNDSAASKAKRSQAIRDLLWVVNSPSLIANSEPEWFAEATAIDPDSIDADRLVEFLSDKVTFRVGHYFEDLVHFYLQYCCKYEILARSLQLQDGSRTIGELDFVFRDAVGKTWHVETAVKFYLHYPKQNHTGSHFVGPNSADTFERKTERLFEHQLPLSSQQSIAIDCRAAYVKGRIFYHRSSGDHVVLPSLLSESHLQGAWIWQSELDQLFEIEDALSNAGRFRIQPKPYWLSDDQVDFGCADLLTAAEMNALLLRHFETDHRPRLISVLDASESAFREKQRIFVVDNSWPEK